MDQTTKSAIIWLSPLIIGIVIALINSTAVNNVTESIERWFRRAQNKVSVGGGWFNNLVLNPVLWVINKFSDWTDSFKHQGLKNGVRISSSLYVLVGWGYLVVLAFMAIVVIVVSVVLLFVVLKAIIDSDRNK